MGTFVVVGGVLGLEEDHENDPSQSWDEEAEQSRLADVTSQFAFLARDAARSLVSMVRRSAPIPLLVSFSFVALTVSSPCLHSSLLLSPPQDDGSSVQLRVGVHCGPVVTGLSGSTTPHYR